MVEITDTKQNIGKQKNENKKTQNKKTKTKPKKNKNEDSLRDLWGNIKCINICITGAPEEEEEREWAQENI